MSEKPLRIVELFQSLQGEGANTGRLAVFIRLADCNLSCSFCDTDFATSHLVLTPTQLLQVIAEKYPHCRSVIWTGGEPTLQLTEAIAEQFARAGYWQAIESNGLRPAPFSIDYITLSPKVEWHRVLENYRGRKVGEVRLPIAKGDPLPKLEELPKANHYFLSPIFEGDHWVPENIEHCCHLIERDSRWRLSLQIHKLIGIR